MTTLTNLNGNGPVAKTTYYVSLTGSDTASGLAPQAAFRTLAKVAQLPLVDGDQIFLEGGSTFEGSLSISNSLTVGSYGKGRATIISPTESAISIEASNVTVHNINLVGQASKKVEEHFGIALLSTGKSRKGYHSIHLYDLDISGFGAKGILIGSIDENRTGFKEVTISNCIVRANYGAGIASWDDAKDRSKGYAHHDLTIRDCAVTGNLDGTGIVIGGVERALIERCEVRDSVGNGGGVGLWAWMAKGVVIRHCIVSGTKSLGGDGGGFDLDGGCVDCIVEECLSYENDGPGFMHCDYPGAPPTTNNICRKSVSINDGRKKGGDNVGFGFVTWGSGLDNCRIERTLTIIELESASEKEQPALFVTHITGSEQKGDIPHVRGCEFQENDVFISGMGFSFYSTGLPSVIGDEVRLRGNQFLTASNVTASIIEGQRFESFESWQKATGHTGSKRVLRSSTFKFEGYKKLKPAHLVTRAPLEYFRRVASVL